jgi:hypothetical protein
MDNYVTHKHANVQSWLKRHSRFVPHFVPTSSSWLNLVERWFGKLTSKAVRRGSFSSVADLQPAIAQFLDAWNEDPKPFVWTATVTAIQAKLSRCRQTLDQIKPGENAGRDFWTSPIVRDVHFVFGTSEYTRLPDRDASKAPLRVWRELRRTPCSLTNGAVALLVARLSPVPCR